jgi:PEP-CTERM motif
MLDCPNRRCAGLIALLATLALAYSGSSLATTLFNNGLPTGWTCTGSCGTSAADGIVTLAPNGGTQYGWVSTANGVTLQGLNLGDETNGSTLLSQEFAATAGQDLSFSFNYITSDGAGYADYGWAELLNASQDPVALLFTARTTPDGNSVPGFGMPSITANITPSTVTITAGAPSFSPLGSSSDTCFDMGCGYSGWVQSDYTIGATGDYYLEFGVVNWADTAYQTAMAFDGITIGGQQIGGGGTPSAPEPATLGLLALGVASIGFARWTRQRARGC